MVHVANVFAESISDGQGSAGERPPMYNDASDGLRYGLREVLEDLGYKTPTAQRSVLCKALRISPDPYSWSDYPNVDNEVAELVAIEPPEQFLAGIQRLPKFLVAERVQQYYEAMNALFAEERVDYRFESGTIVRLVTEQIHAAIEQAKVALEDAKFAEPRRQLERGYDFLIGPPADWANAIKEAANSVEGALQVIYGQPGTSLTTIVSANFPEDVPSGVKKLFQAIYSQASGTTGARHASIGGNKPTGPRAELALHVAAALHKFAVSELDTSQ